MLSQRFYFFEAQTGISVDEAYRFLQNRWLEKQMQAKKKQSDESNRRQSENDANLTSDSGLLRKKRVTRNQVIKKSK